MDNNIRPVLLKYAAYAMTNNCLNNNNQCPHKEQHQCPIHKSLDCKNVDVKDWILYLADEAYLLIDINETQEN